MYIIFVFLLFMSWIKIITHTADKHGYMHMCNAPAKNAHHEGEYWQVTVWILPVSINQLKCFTCANKVQKLKIASPINQQISMYLPLAHIDTIHASG